MALILIIDDDELIRITLHTILERAGYETTMATNGRDGLNKFRARPVDLIILDMILPEKGGIEALIEFRQAQPNRCRYCCGFGLGRLFLERQGS